MTASYAAPQLETTLSERLKARGFRVPYIEDHGLVLVHDACGKEFVYLDHAQTEIIDRETREHSTTCTADVPLKSVGR